MHARMKSAILKPSPVRGYGQENWSIINLPALRPIYYAGDKQLTTANMTSSVVTSMSLSSSRSVGDCHVGQYATGSHVHLALSGDET